MKITKVYFDMAYYSFVRRELHMYYLHTYFPEIEVEPFDKKKTINENEIVVFRSRAQHEKFPYVYHTDFFDMLYEMRIQDFVHPSVEELVNIILYLKSSDNQTRLMGRKLISYICKDYYPILIRFAQPVNTITTLYEYIYINTKTTYLQAQRGIQRQYRTPESKLICAIELYPEQKNKILNCIDILKHEYNIS